MEENLSKDSGSNRPILPFISKYIFFAGCVLFCVTLPFRAMYNNLAISVMVAGWVFDGDLKTKWNNLKINRAAILPVLSFMVCLFSVVYSDDKATAMNRLETKLPLIILPVIICSSYLQPKQIFTLLNSFVVCMVATTIYCFVRAALQYRETGELSHFFYHGLTEPIKPSAIYFANYLCFSILVILFARTHLAYLIKWKMFLIVLMGLTIVMLASLTVVGYLICLLVIFGWHYLRQKFSLAKTLITIVASVVVFVAIILTMPFTKTKVLKMADLHYEMNYPDSMWNTATIRLAKWKSAGTVIQENPLLGVGIGDEQASLMKSYEKLNFSEGMRNEYNEHNQYLAAIVSAGFPGLVILLAMLLVPLWMGLKKQDYLLSAFMLLMIFSFSTENFLYIQKGVLFFAFFYSLLIKNHNQITRVSPL